MVKVEQLAENEIKNVPKNLFEGKRHLTAKEIEILEKNLNHNSDPSWNNFYVDNEEGAFDPSLIHMSFFSGFIVLGKLKKLNLHFNDLILECGIRRSNLHDVVTGDDCVIRNVYYMDNYRIGNRVIIFNIQELCCTKHSKFGNGILKKGEPEEHRIWIGVANENDGRAILPFEDMIPADAYLWSHYREDKKLLDKFKALTENENSRELDTYGIIGNDCVIKNSSIIKDTKIYDSAYIKGAFKLKNITILSSEEEPSQIGEGVELVNGILGYGCKVFYQAIAVRFVIGRNCQVKYGARLLNSVLGDNSTVSCCEILNNLIYPFHEQHHNSSFLIATTVMGQSNIAAGATIGSNHNSRSPDGEIFAKRGFWPGLCSDFKHNSRFASFTLISKGSYQYELDIPYPFALVAQGTNGSPKITIIPAWWFMYDMFAITRNKNKFLSRDKRVKKIQHIETDPLAPDTMQEVIAALDRLIFLTSEYLKKIGNDYMNGADTPEKVYQAAKDFLHQNPQADFTLDDPVCQKKYGAVIIKPVQSYKMYRKIVKYFATRTLMEFCSSLNHEKLTFELVDKIRQFPLFTEWENAGGQIIPSNKIQELFTNIKKGEIKSWKSVHQFYDQCQSEYEKYKVRYALYLLEQLYSRPIEEFTVDVYRNVTEDVTIVADDIYNASLQSREKDYTDYYRKMTYVSEREMQNVIGILDENSFLCQLNSYTEKFKSDIFQIFLGLTK
ncbi:DUF4954 family protein [Treponema sp. Marseille-Q3903]|uniref:DUF4954 family protein n=1 Tax=Treponema sp. Marseille-Q3903 TaxID=2766703 RepID=UPI001651F317|nr:DUF4954 family protein [Treponema sp. Marseille-Q3903]MBC6714390.1 DUF4954 family protein [Treponema sp. Marseille-Q3903]